MAYDRQLESVRGAKEQYDEAQRSAAAARLKAVAAKKKAKRASKKEAQA